MHYELMRVQGGVDLCDDAGHVQNYSFVEQVPGTQYGPTPFNAYSRGVDAR